MERRLEEPSGASVSGKARFGLGDDPALPSGGYDPDAVLMLHITYHVPPGGVSSAVVTWQPWAALAGAVNSARLMDAIVATFPGLGLPALFGGLSWVRMDPSAETPG
jgi:hypothetical protein